MNAEKNLILDVEEKPKKIREWLLFSVQHVLAMFVACITVPLITGLPVAPTVVAAGVGTLCYIFFTKGRSPIFLSSSFAYLSPMAAALALGATTNALGQVLPNYWALAVGMALVGAVYLVVALIIKIFGVAWLEKLLPPIVIGPVIMVIGLSLSASAISNLTHTSSGAAGYNLIDILCGLIAMLATALAANYGKKISMIPFIIGMAAGYLAAGLFTAFGYAFNNDYLKIIDFSPLISAFEPLNVTSFVSVPDFLFTLRGSPLEAGQLGEIALLFIPVAFVTISEHIGDHENLSSIIGRDLLKDPGLDRTLAGDGMATAISGLLCGAANTTYGENVAVVGITRIASTAVVALAAVISIVIGFVTPLMALTQTIPSAVTGGVSLILYGFIAASGVKMLIAERIDFNKTKNIFVASVILVSGIGGLTLKFGDPSDPSIEITSIAVSMILGIALNLILKDNDAEKKNSTANKAGQKQ